MSNKETILHIALRLFAEQGYDGTPTNQIAREAGVSEGLIFRHFGNKAGLLAAIIQAGSAQVETTMAAYARETDPRAAIAQHIRESFSFLRQNAAFWRLIQQIRFQVDVQQTAVDQIGDFQRNVAERLTANFRLLGATRPAQEALLLFALIEGITAQYLQGPEKYPLDAMQDFLIQKYQDGNFLGQP